MSMQEERLRILQMIADGNITAQEGAELLDALGQGKATDQPVSQEGGKPRWLRVQVWEKGKAAVNIRVPWGLVAVGLKIAHRFVPDQMGDVQAALEEALVEGKLGKIAEVEDAEDNERVVISVE